ncbi:Imidazole glycerol phosphate synthase hisHF [Hondaea fermentalgiana]|uniref:Imidazole glycerol phosphate synthase hisHF n=1 Tax=Hondaea fermentalgiana TaxID=2315210 RepID=A0A2R5GKW5_9STRA|nr:Imidazole glycerol phosphate synthase hisHF [Hondaea fermentalgiana]|eukprot:GBG31527.1 Imidazole glycerol phosphate synthase hisHF [Hondaea fermentalgiana]
MAAETSAEAAASQGVVHVLDYGAGNVRSVENAITKCGYEVKTIVRPEEILEAELLVFPGVGSFGNAMRRLQEKGFEAPLKEYIAADRPFFGICLGMQTLFEGSEEEPGLPGLGAIPGIVRHFNAVEGFSSDGSDDTKLTVPHIGWNGVVCRKPSRLFASVEGSMADKRAYFVHSYCALATEANKDWVLCTTQYGIDFVSAVQKGNVMATQFHPEKSGGLGLAILKGFLSRKSDPTELAAPDALAAGEGQVAQVGLSRRIIACLDVRKNDAGDLVVTKGDGYDVREKKKVKEDEAAKEEAKAEKGAVRNFGKPAELAKRYYEDGADEVTFLNITQFREDTMEAETMHEMLRAVSQNVFVPLTIGGGIRDYGDRTALEVAAKYFRSGADKVSLGSYAVEAVIRLRDELGGKPDGSTAIEKISTVYGNQAVVISVDPRRIYLETDDEVAEAEAKGYKVFEVVDDRAAADRAAYARWLRTSVGEEPPAESEVSQDEADAASRPSRCWFQCTVAGGRKRRPLDAIQLVQGVEKLGAGEILLNSIDKDGKNSGFDIALVDAVRSAVGIPVIASSGAGAPEHFVEVFSKTKAEAALAAGIFHREEVEIDAVKAAVDDAGLPVRRS